MKIVFVLPSLGAGGAERTVVNLVKYLTKSASLNITVLTLIKSPDFYELDPKVDRVRMDFTGRSGSIFEIISRMLKVRKAIRSLKPDWVVSFMTPVNTFVLISLVFSSINVIVSERNDPKEQLSKFQLFYSCWVYHFMAYKLIVQTYGVLNIYNRIVALSKIIVIPNAITKTTKYWKGGSKNPKFQIIAVGRLHYQKGYDILINIFAHSDFCRKFCMLKIYGEGEQESSLEYLIIDLKMSECIKLMGGSNYIDDQLIRADLFVSSSRYEGFPNVLLEALSLGVPTVAMDCDFGPSEIIEHEYSGLLVPINESNHLGEAIHILLENEELKKSISKNAIKSTEKYFPEKIMPLWIDLFDKSNGTKKQYLKYSANSKSC